MPINLALPAIPQGSDVLIALKRSHLLAKVARDGERNASGRAPDICVFWSGEAWAAAAARRRLRGCGIGFAMLLAGGDLAAEAQKIPYGMVPYARPVFKNGKRMLWHGAWRGGLGRYARQSAAPAAAKPVLALTPEPTNQPVQKSLRSSRTPATPGRAGWPRISRRS